MKNKIDLEAIIFMYIHCLKEEKKKKYTAFECEDDIAYLFEDYDSYKNYFIDNGMDYVSDETLDNCRIRVTKKGSIIALKALCDCIIREYRASLYQMKQTIEESNGKIVKFKKKKK